MPCLEKSVVVAEKRELWLVLLASLIWLPGLRGNYFLSDDFSLVENWGAANLARWFFSEYGGYYRPLVALVFKLDYSLWGLVATGYYLTNFAIHVGCTLLVWDITRHFFSRQSRQNPYQIRDPLTGNN